MKHGLQVTEGEFTQYSKPKLNKNILWLCTNWERMHLEHSTLASHIAQCNHANSANCVICISPKFELHDDGKNYTAICMMVSWHTCWYLPPLPADGHICEPSWFESNFSVGFKFPFLKGYGIKTHSQSHHLKHSFWEVHFQSFEKAPISCWAKGRGKT